MIHKLSNTANHNLYDFFSKIIFYLKLSPSYNYSLRYGKLQLLKATTKLSSFIFLFPPFFPFFYQHLQ